MSTKLTLQCPLTNKRAVTSWPGAQTGTPTLTVADDDPAPFGWGSIEVSVIQSSAALARKLAEGIRASVADKDEAERAEAEQVATVLAAIPDKKIRLTWTFDPVSDDAVRRMQEVFEAFGSTLAAPENDAVLSFLMQDVAGAEGDE